MLALLEFYYTLKMEMLALLLEFYYTVKIESSLLLSRHVVVTWERSAAAAWGEDWECNNSTQQKTDNVYQRV